MILGSVHPRTNVGHMKVSNPEMRIFAQGQGNQGIARRRTFCTPHKRFRRLTQRLGKKAIYGWKLGRAAGGVIIRGRK